MNYRGKIGISTVLAEIRDNPGDDFWLEFVKSDGSGAVRIIAKALYGRGKTAKREQGSGRIKKKAMFKRTSQLPITNYETGEFRTPLISHIIGYNQYQVTH